MLSVFRRNYRAALAVALVAIGIAGIALASTIADHLPQTWEFTAEFAFCVGVIGFALDRFDRKMRQARGNPRSEHFFVLPRKLANAAQRAWSKRRGT